MVWKGRGGIMLLVTDGIETELTKGDFYFSEFFFFLPIGVQCKTNLPASSKKYLINIHFSVC